MMECEIYVVVPSQELKCLVKRGVLLSQALSAQLEARVFRSCPKRHRALHSETSGDLIPVVKVAKFLGAILHVAFTKGAFISSPGSYRLGVWSVCTKGLRIR